MKAIYAGITAFFLLFSSASWALTLQDAKRQGLVGETLSGYLAPVNESAQAKEFADKINQARLEQYKKVAEQNGLRTEDVAKMAGKKLIDRAPSGEYVKGINGLWLKK
ncbi:hypothetical protein SOASR030_06790 [Leminorella grimontii]|uniref:DUF1318 domain-containing protein n=1 Tax=Leminorella grimontii TaxID=82981 RepID=A0AAV5N1L5_9GAMM|nr:YdbL family protein [Leminorella grimontii]KFC96243.1 YdbL family protein [Leminorella grimontii ATCC 33999 = DSM 5078]GKX54567.1 hypothetical protein SOASR030_06790 [Leminorella grimontii]GKX57985.1 hypothetical protein SOASR031_03000 [Leminorella grimontii]VFS58912.1 Uncharacterized protein conserved in bacteria [Leminorella grimontii]